MYFIFHDLFTLQQLQFIGEEKTVFNFDFLSIKSIIIAIVIGLIYIFVMHKLIKKYRNYNHESRTFYLRGVFTLLTSIIVIFSLFLTDMNAFNDYFTETNLTAFKRVSFKKYGIAGYCYKEVGEIIH